MSGKGDTYRKLNSEQRKAFEDNFDRIFSKNKATKTNDEWDEKRIDIIGSNGNEALHYEELKEER